MKNITFKKVLPYLAGIVIFILITMFYFSPLMEGKKLFQSDIANFQGASKEIVDYRNQTGEEALWTNSMFGGMPAYQISVKYTGNLLRYFDQLFMLGLPAPANLVFLYFLGFFILLLVMRVDPWLSIAGAISFALSSFFFLIIDAGHNSQAHAIGYVAPTLAAIILVFRKKYLLGGILTAFLLSLELLTNHPQITYYMVLIAVIYGITELIQAIRRKEYFSFLKSVGIIIIASVFALLTNITSLWATLEYGKYTIRGKSELTTEKENRTSGLDRDYVTQWSYGKAETMTLLIPDFYGGSSNVKIGKDSKIVDALKANNIPESTIKQFTSQPVSFMYWGNQPFTSGPVYVGAIIFFLFILGLIIVKGPFKWWLLSATVLSIFLAWGHNFMAFTDFFLNYIPGYNKFRAVTMALVIAEVAMPLLGILALKEIFDNLNDQKRLFKALKMALIVVGGITLLFAIVPGMFLDFIGPKDKLIQDQYKFPDWLMQAIRDERLSLVMSDALRALFFVILTAGLIWAVLFKKLQRQYAPFILMVLFLADMVVVNKRYVNNDNFTSKSRVANPFELTPEDEQILQDKSLDYRVMNLSVDPFNDASTSYFHKSIGGYHGAKLRRYQELIENQISKNNTEVLNMLNTKYLIFTDQSNKKVVQYNPAALGNAWFVKAYNMVENPDAELKALTKFNPKDTLIIEKRWKSELTTYTPGRDPLDVIKLEEYKPNHLIYSYQSKNNGLAAFSEIYYPEGWNASVDGKPTSHFRVNYVLRGMVLPAGTHKVEFIFHPKVYFIGEKISLISSILLLVLMVIFAGIEIRKAIRSNA
jgi:Bacterial membrane protein YfhO